MLGKLYQHYTCMHQVALGSAGNWRIYPHLGMLRWTAFRVKPNMHIKNLKKTTYLA